MEIHKSIFKDYLRTFLTSGKKVALFVSPTGTGKTTQIPQILFEEGYTVFIEVPTTPSVINLYEYMKVKNRRYQDDIGYATGTNVSYSNRKIRHIQSSIKSNKISPDKIEHDQRCVYCTPGHLLKIMFDCIKFTHDETLKNNRNVLFCDILFVDEIHLGTLDIEFIIRIWKYLNDRGFEVPKLIMASATIEGTPYFDEDEVEKFNIQYNSNFPVEKIFHTRSYQAFQYHILLRDMATAIIRKHQEVKTYGSWLVFLPGLREIQDMKDELSILEDVEILTVHSSVSAEEMTLIFTEPPIDKRRIILSTNIAETSLTIPNLSGIFDSLLERIAEESPMGGISLLLAFISKSSAVQRAGRTGRTCEGFIYRMCTENEFNNFLNQMRVPEIERLPINNLLIKCISIGADFRSLFIGVDPAKLDRTFLQLQKSGAVSETTIPLKITPLGHFVIRFPLSFNCSVFLYRWISSYNNLGKKNNPYPGIVIACLIDKADQFLKVKDPKTDFFDNIRSIFPLVQRIYLWLCFYADFLNINPKYRLIKKFCHNNDISLKTFLELRRSIHECILIMQKISRPFQIGLFDVGNNLKLAYPILINIFNNRFIFSETRKGFFSKYDIQKGNLRKEYKINKHEVYFKPEIKEVCAIYVNMRNKFIVLWLPILPENKIDEVFNELSDEYKLMKNTIIIPSSNETIVPAPNDFEEDQNVISYINNQERLATIQEEEEETF